MNPSFPGWLLWLDAEPARYWFVAWTCFALTVGAAVFLPNTPASLRQRLAVVLIFPGLLLLTLLAFRWPAWFNPEEFNPDESQIIAGALTLRDHPVPWKYIDAGSHGPVSEFSLLAFSWLGFPLNHASARALAVTLQWLALIATWRMLESLAPGRPARIGIFSGFAFWAFSSWVDLVHYATELPGLTLCALAGWAWLRPLLANDTGPKAHWRFFAGAMAAGLVPLTKPQQVPLAMAMGLIVLIVLLRRTFVFGQAAQSRAIGWLLCGAVVPTGCLAVFLSIYNLWSHFWHAYVLSALAYASDGHHSFWAMPGAFFNFSATSFDFAWFFWGGLAFCLVYARQPCPPPFPMLRRLAWGLLGVAMFCTLRPCREVVHYLHILVLPLTALCGLTLAAAMAGTPSARWRIGLACLLLAVAPLVYHRAMSWNGHLGHLRDLPVAPSAITAYLRSHAQAGETLAVWGWEPKLYVDTQLPQGTRSGVTAYELFDWPLRDFYVGRYRNDLLRRQPTWFVDAVGPGAFIFEDRGRFGHETVPAVAAIITRDYEFIAAIETARIYRLKSAVSVK